MAFFSMLPLAFATEPEELTIPFDSIDDGYVNVPAGCVASIDVPEAGTLTISKIRLVDPIFEDETSVALTINLTQQESNENSSFDDIFGGLGFVGGDGIGISPPDGESIRTDTSSLIFSTDFNVTIELSDNFLRNGAQNGVVFSLFTFNSATFGKHWTNSGLDGELFDYITFVTERDEELDVEIVDEIVGTKVNESSTFKVAANIPKVNIVPEPTTATLSLLALAGLAARRRRK